MSQRQIDINGFVTIPRNPISRAGVFPYLGRGLPDADPAKIYNVYRPESELSNPETIASFRLLPIINDHVMLGNGFDTAAEQKGVHGSTGEDVVFENGVLYSTLRIFSDALKGLIDSGKRALSCGYRTTYEKTSGFFNGQAYDYIQRNIRGNHLALVEAARCDVAVLDGFAFDSFDLTINEGENSMADGEETKKEETTEAKAGMTLEEAAAHLDKILPMLESMNSAIAALASAKPADDTITLDKDDKDEKDKEKEKDAMDAKAMDSLSTRVEAVEKRSTKGILAEVSRRDKLVRDVLPHVGTFDHAEMTAGEVAKYALDKLSITAPAGHEETALTAFLAGRKHSPVGFSLDAGLKKEGKLSKRLNRVA